VAASDARTESQDAADYVCDGTDDHVQIQAALDVCGTLGFGDVVLSEGNFACSLDSIIVPTGVSLRGVGMYNTTLHDASGGAGIMITIGGDNVEVRDLGIEDRTAAT
jgi:hypothetical protein